jgi:branched-chain amino acid transport system ATP-binding protein
MLAVSDLTAAYGSVPVLNGVSLSLAKGEVLALLGRNGVGKTTLLRTLTGLLPALGGRIELDGVAIAGLPTHAISRMGVALVPQGRGIFAKLSVRENLVAGGRAAKGRGAVPLDEILARFPALRDRLGQAGGTLSGGEQQQLAIARALSARPNVVLLDEPSEGIQPNVVHDIGELIGRLVRETGLAVLLVEQNIDFALHTASRCAVMEKGRIVHEGGPEELRSDAVLKRYLAI